VSLVSDLDKGDAYFEIQMDRETVVLAAVGFVFLLVVAFLVGRWTAPGPVTGAGDVPAPTAADRDRDTTTRAEIEESEVDSKPQFGSTPVDGGRVSPAIAPVPDRPVPSREPATSTKKSPSPTGTSSSAPPKTPTKQPAATKTAQSKQPAPKQAMTPPPAPRPAPVPVEPVAPGESASPDGGEGGGYVVQVLAANTPVDADKLSSRLRRAGYTVRTLEEQGLYKVQVGPYSDMEEARAAERRLKRDEKLGTWIRRQ